MDQKKIVDVQRHDLLEITDWGRKAALDLALSSMPGSDGEQFRKVIMGGLGETKVPGIARREESQMKPGYIPVGFASAWRVAGNRIRIPAFVPVETVIRIVQPQQVMRMPCEPRTPCLKAFKEIGLLADDRGLEMGVWGSSALEIFTGLPYTDESSDLDLIVGTLPLEVMREYWESIRKVGQKCQCSIDVEISLPNGFGVKLAEVLSNSHSVLGKGLQDVILLDREEIMTLLQP